MAVKQGYDLIGDVHGCALSLKLLLRKLGYSKRSGVYRHPQRKVIFIGDIIDRGPRVREALHIVRDMVEAGEAEIVMGNHEYNFLCYCTPAQDGEGFIREHNPRNRRILQETLNQFANHRADQNDFLKWILDMPLLIEKDDFRVVHACWHQQLIDRFLASYPDARIDEDFLHRSDNHDTFEWTLLDRLLRGTHLRLPEGEIMVSKDGYRRKFFRTKFWAESPEYYADVVFQPDPLPEHVAKTRLTDSDYLDLIHYGRNEKPLFIGHFWRNGEPEPITENIACLDYSAVKFGKLVAYRYDGEPVVSKERFVWIDVQKDIFG